MTRGANLYYCHALSDRRRVLDCQLDLLDYSVQLQLQHITMYTLHNSSLELNARLATAPQPVFHYNTLLASLAIISSLLLRRIIHSIFQQLPGYQPQLAATQSSEVYDLWADCRGDSAFGIGCLAITRETGTLKPRACTLPSNVYSMACTSHYVCVGNPTEQ
jgi:hypothetical protein